MVLSEASWSGSTVFSKKEKSSFSRKRVKGIFLNEKLLSWMLTVIFLFLWNAKHTFVNIYIFEAILKWILRILQLFIASWITQIWLTAAKLTCLYNTLQTLNSFARSDTGVVIDSKPHLNHMCKTSLLFAPLAVRVQTGCSADPFYTPTKLLIRLYFEYKNV